MIELDEESRRAMQADISKKILAIPDTSLSESWAKKNISVPEKIRLGDNPYFEVYKKMRERSNLA